MATTKKTVKMTYIEETKLENPSESLFINVVQIEWNTLLSVEYLESINCWATLED